MPYLTKENRNLLNAGNLPTNPGELNYLFTTEIVRYLNAKGIRYQTLNDVIGALEGAKLEFYRQIAAPYEDYKQSRNGDVYAPVDAVAVNPKED